MSATITMTPSPAPHNNRRPSYSAPQSKATNSHSPPSRYGAAVTSTKPVVSHLQKSKPASASMPKIVVKEEPESPRMAPATITTSPTKALTDAPPPKPQATRRPEPLNLPKSKNPGIAILSPGLSFNPPHMDDVLKRVGIVQMHQRDIIKSRQSAKSDNANVVAPDGNNAGANGNHSLMKRPGFSAKRNGRAPPNLSIVGNPLERAIQSAPLGQTFTGYNRPPPHHILNTMETPRHQAGDRLPPISDMFHKDYHHEPPTTRYLYAPPADNGPLTSPGLPPPHMQHLTSRSSQSFDPCHAPLPSHHEPPPPPEPYGPRSAPHNPPMLNDPYKNAEEAQWDLAGGRPERLPRLVHYGSHNPPTPPSPQPPRYPGESRNAGKRRSRVEYEEGVPPLEEGPTSTRQGPFGYRHDSPRRQQEKREEFLTLCGRIWDLFHS